MTNLVIAEHDNNSLKPATLNTITAAVEIGGDITVLVAGSNCQAAIDGAVAIAGVTIGSVSALFGCRNVW